MVRGWLGFLYYINGFIVFFIGCLGVSCCIKGVSCVDDYMVFLGGVIIDWIIGFVFVGVLLDEGFLVVIFLFKGLFECGVDDREIVFIIY